MEWLVIGKFAKAYWSQIALGLAIIGLSLSLGITRRTLSVRTTTLHNTEVAYQNFQNEVKNKTEAAKLADQAHADAVKAKDEAIRIANEKTLDDQLADAHRLANEYADRLRDKTTGSPRSVGPSGVGSTTNPSGATTDPGTPSVVDDPTVRSDAEICAENTVKADGWLKWYVDVKAVPDRQ